MGEYKIIKRLDNKDNGAQGFAVAPVDKNGNIDTSQIVIAFRSTEFPDDKLDVATDVQQVVQGEKQLKVFDKNEMRGKTKISVYKKVDSQFTSALKFAQEIKKEHPNATISTTGHSLGAGMAQFVAVEEQLRAVTYAAPNVYRLLSAKGKEAVKSGNQGARR
ncbi:hypothetical protein QS257_01615 [Terrilactibacillus sp. S3-3]|nr:hypothetical protein QS257_01615 [Terrilactibacillus sp. S3-3]